MEDARMLLREINAGLAGEAEKNSEIKRKAAG